MSANVLLFVIDQYEGLFGKQGANWVALGPPRFTVLFVLGED